MSEFLNVIFYASIPFIGNFIGAMLAVVLKVTKRLLSYSPHLAAFLIFW